MVCYRTIVLLYSRVKFIYVCKLQVFYWHRISVLRFTADEEAASRALDILVAELELYEELLRKQGEVLAEATADGELRAEKQEFAEQAVLYRYIPCALKRIVVVVCVWERDRKIDKTDRLERER